MVRHSTVSARSAHAAIQRAGLPILTTAVPLVAMQVDDLSTISLSSTFSFFLFKAKKRISVITSSGIVFYCLKKNCFFSSYSLWTSTSLDVPAGVTQEEGQRGFFIHFLYAVRALTFLARRIQPFLSLVKRLEFCVRLNRSPLVGNFFLVF